MNEWVYWGAGKWNIHGIYTKQLKTTRLKIDSINLIKS